jgi:hypothetical protein
LKRAGEQDPDQRAIGHATTISHTP